LKNTILVLLSILFIWSCGSSDSNIDEDKTFNQKNDNYYTPKPLTSYNIVLGEDNIPTSYDAKIVELDSFDTSKELINTLQKKGKKVFAYVSVGSWENYREDKKDFPKQIIGKIYPGWEDEKFLNIKEIDKLKPIMEKRFEMIREKGFIGVEADNLDIYTADIGKNGTGFNISLKDTKKYADFLINLSHEKNLSIGQKNAPEFVEVYGDLFDWALLEDAFFEGYADKFEIYTKNNKAVFAIEYLDNTSKEVFLKNVCPQAKKLKFTAILKNRTLDALEYKCPR